MMTDIARILIVDDDEVDRMAIHRALIKTRLSLSIEEVTNGADAIAQLTPLSAHAAPVYSWALLDYQLPDLNGLVLVKQLRQQGVQIPLIVLTGQGDEQIAVDLMKAGASDYLIKAQLSSETLSRRLQNTLRIYRAEQKTAETQAELYRTNALLRQQNQALEQQRQQIEQVNQKLVQANRIKTAMMQQRDDFVARLTHDLRTPLIAANRMLQFCHDGTFGAVEAEVQEAIASIINSNQHLLHMVNSLLDVYRHEAGEKQLTFCPCNLLELILSVVNELQVLATEKGLDLVIQAPPDATTLPTSERQRFQLQGDPLELRRVLVNLVGNAIKFTDRGAVSLYLHCLKSAPAACAPTRSPGHWPRPANRDNNSDTSSKWLSLRVEDTGIGIFPGDQALIFDQFRQVQTLRSGSGLGLHLAQRIAQLHGGQITVESVPNQGSTFTLDLPISPPSRENSP